MDPGTGAFGSSVQCLLQRGSGPPYAMSRDRRHCGEPPWACKGACSTPLSARGVFALDVRNLTCLPFFIGSSFGGLGAGGRLADRLKMRSIYETVTLMFVCSSFGSSHSKSLPKHVENECLLDVCVGSIKIGMNVFYGSLRFAF